MKRREFIRTGAGGITGLGMVGAGLVGRESAAPSRPGPVDLRHASPLAEVRDQFPRLGRDVYLNAAAGTPLSTFAEEALDRYREFWRYGGDDGRGEVANDVMSESRAAFARLVGASPTEVAWSHCTKAGEQLILDNLPALRAGGNLVTNDLHFGGSLHNLLGLREQGLDVRIVRARDFEVDLEDMKSAIDERTALVAVTLVSNVNGRIEPMAELSAAAHDAGALVYADIIQAAGVVPIDVEAMGIDFAACSGYKWMYGPHGVGFLYVKESLQESALERRRFPGHSRPNYAPWVSTPDPSVGEYGYRAPSDARRYQPGHVSYMGYAALLAGLRFIEEVGVPEIQRHTTTLAKRIAEGLDPDRYRLISPDVDQSPILAFQTADAPALEERLRAARLVISLSAEQIRISPGVYNNDEDVDVLLDVLNA